MMMQDVQEAMAIVAADELASFVDAMIADLSVIGVKAKDGAEDRFVFGALGDAGQLRLEHDVTILPPKKYVLPPHEKLAKITLGPEPSADSCTPKAAPAVLIGVHPYDMVAINQIDRLMMREGSPDPNYVARRQSLTIIGVDPARPGQRAFWGDMDCEKVEGGFDLWLTPIDGAYVVEIGSDKGAALLEKYAATREVTEADLDACKQVRGKLKAIGSQKGVSFGPMLLPSLLRGSFDSKVWDEKSEKCLSCGSCNLVCPTCYCFDVADEIALSLDSVTRSRSWDGCVLENFAKVAGDENFRERRSQRYRHRFYRKGMYQYDKYGQIACVGCGRCASACLPDIADPVAVYGALKEGSTK